MCFVKTMLQMSCNGYKMVYAVDFELIRVQSPLQLKIVTLTRLIFYEYIGDVSLCVLILLSNGFYINKFTVLVRILEKCMIVIHSPLLFQNIFKFSAFDFYFTFPLVVQNVLVGLPVGC